jgi:hypothetical protein
VANFFDIESAKDLFDVAEQRFERYCAGSTKSAEDLILIIMIVNHLREWIAPGFGKKYDKKSKTWTWPVANSEAKKFSRKVYEHANFDLIRKLCNGTKHAKTVNKADTQYEENIFAWPNLFAVKNIFRGVPVSHSVDGKPVDALISPIMEMYRDWFHPQALGSP